MGVFAARLVKSIAASLKMIFLSAPDENFNHDLQPFRHDPDTYMLPGSFAKSFAGKKQLRLDRPVAEVYRS